MGLPMLLGEEIHVVPALAPADISSDTYTDVIGFKEYHNIQILVMFGAITGDTVTLTVEECDDTTPSNSTAVAFKYRKSSAVGTDSMGAVSSATTSGITVSATDDNKVILVEVDPATLTRGYPYIRVKLAPGGSISACFVGAVAILVPRYPQTSQLSAVD
ncbi:MAG: hypothetical protein ACTSPV_00845 [Candidatus Hodarchaeales archaeon]